MTVSFLGPDLGIFTPLVARIILYLDMLTPFVGGGYYSPREANMKKKLVLALACALVLLASGMSPQKPLKVLVLYDMEGVSGASSVRHTNFGADPEYTEGRKSLTADVNAAIAGLKAAGATEIIVSLKGVPLRRYCTS